MMSHSRPADIAVSFSTALAPERAGFNAFTTRDIHSSNGSFLSL